MCWLESGDMNMARVLAGFIAAAVVVSAGSLTGQDSAELFSRLDANKDGYVTSEEVQQPQQTLFERLLRNADKDGDKKLSKEEFVAGLKGDESPRPPLAGGAGVGPRGGNPGARLNPANAPDRAMLEALF